jgi:erythromycin esterase-like protein
MADLSERIRDAAHLLVGGDNDYAPLLELASGAEIVLLGEASHGTHEFYRERAEITKRLISQLGFAAVAVEADWPDAERVGRWVRWLGNDETSLDALSGFLRFPQWMWRNADVLAFLDWLRLFNRDLSLENRVGFFGIDLYSLHASIDAVLRYLGRVDPEAAQRARWRYSCFEHFGEDPQAYGHSASFDLSSSCEEEAIRQLVELRRLAAAYAGADHREADEALFSAEQNARLVKNAEEYYRSMFRARVSSWNLRDRHMTETLDAIAEYLKRKGRAPKIIVWAHNSHLGDARATEMGRRGELNVGQLVRQRHGQRALLVGFSTYTGTVTAASNWDEPPERKWVRPALSGSYETLFHDVGLPRFLLTLRDGALAGELSQPRLERAIGVIYRPETERLSHYFQASLSAQFDAMIHLDETQAVEPLERNPVWDEGEVPETYPFAV